MVLLSLVGAVAPWFFTSDVAALIARQEPVILNAYHVNHFLVLACLTTPFFLIAAWCWWLRKTKSRRQIAFRLIALIFALVIGVVAVEVVGRMLRKPRYVTSSVAQMDHWPRDHVLSTYRSRPPNRRYEVTYTDRPEARRSYPNAPDGYGTVEATLTTDERGFRNLQHAEAPTEGYDVVVLGDSFAEGSRVSDEATWPRRLASTLGVSLYNLAISGANPDGAIAALEAHIETLRPKHVLLMVYEGNDFKGSRRTGDRATPSLSARLERIVETSAIYLGLKRAAISSLGGVGANSMVGGWHGLDWMPHRVSSQQRTAYYSYKPKRLLRLMKTPDAFRASRGWTDTAGAFARLKALCDAHACSLHLLYAPSKPHVVYPLVADSVDAASLHRFLSYQTRNAPDVSLVKDVVNDNLDTLEDTTRTFCERNEISFVSLTEPLRGATQEGMQTYFTYDQHWSPAGHEVVANELVRVLRMSLTK